MRNPFRSFWLPSIPVLIILLSKGCSHRLANEHSASILPVAYSPSGRLLASGSHDTAVRISSGDQPTHVLNGRSGAVLSICFSDDECLLASGSQDGVITLWDLKSDLSQQLLPSKYGPVWSVSFSRGGVLLVSGHDDGSITIWDVGSRQQITSIRLEHTVRAVRFSPSGETFASAGDDTAISLFSVTNAALLRQLNGHKSAVGGIAFSPDARVLASVGGTLTAESTNRFGEIRLWNLSTYEEIWNNVSHTDGVRTVEFSPSGDLFATGSIDGTVRLWNVQNGTEELEIRIGTPVWSLSFSPDGKNIAVGCASSRRIRIYDVESGNERSSRDP